MSKAAPTIDMYLTLLTHELTRYDMACSKREAARGRVNVYRLGLLLEAADRVRTDINAEGEAVFRVSLALRFEPDFPPIKRVIKQLDAGTCVIK